MVMVVGVNGGGKTTSLGNTIALREKEISTNIISSWVLFSLFFCKEFSGLSLCWEINKLFSSLPKM